MLILLIRGIYVGLRYGFLDGIFKIFGIIIALFVSIRYYPNVAQFLTQQFFFSKLPPAVNEGLSFTILMLAVLLIFKLGRIATQFVIQFEAVGPLERFGGAICGFIHGGIIAGLILFILNLLPMEYFKKSINEDSWSGSYLVKVGPAIYNTIIKFSPEKKSE